MYALSSFQFHDGAIGRLESYRESLRNESFQFHDGAIGSIKETGGKLYVVRFNSMMVRLEDDLSICAKRTPPSFNSMMVRLEATTIAVCFHYVNLFQFHDGAIGRRGNFPLYP